MQKSGRCCFSSIGAVHGCEVFLSQQPENFKLGLVTPVPPPNGGMAMQGQKLTERLAKEGIAVSIFPSNPKFPFFLKFAERIKVLRTFIRLLIYIWDLRRLKSVDQVHILAASHFFFFASVAPAMISARLFRRQIILNYRGGEAERFFFQIWLPGLALFENGRQHCCSFRFSCSHFSAKL